ncbi:CaiB/BaiF CoA-transferase family protein [uncultured Methylibium sp.]|uniref:CaiB/BaiF CoA transferase family protein n=1 Tax=uncultured Methylibium sp. TaxID=381093 RepID=UPI0025EAD6B4|nr:CaiB/BaiF CoA-transferase family protein [uncultured Methylibium sp.]
MAGPLAGLKVVEMVGLGPAPFCAMLLADMGAEVIRIDRPGAGGALGLDPRFDLAARGRRSLALDLRKPGAVEAVLRLVERADALVEGYRPGVMERLGLGPETCLQRKPPLVYGRMTGWGQHGPLAARAGHDINYIALSGGLAAIGREGEPPVPPLNYVGDYGGGAMLLAFGLMCALHEARGSGQGQVVDAAMTDGSALLSAMFYGMRAAGAWSTQRETNLIDGGAPFYACYACADGKAIAVGAIEAQFYTELLQRLDLPEADYLPQMDRARWPARRADLAARFATRTRDAWCEVFAGSDACFAPVLDWDEAPRHPHHQAREAFVDIAGVTQPAPAPRFSRTPPATPGAPAVPGADGEAVLRDWGFDEAAIVQLRRDGAL